MAKWTILDWKDELAPGASRESVPFAGQADVPGYALDTFGTPQWRNDWVDNGDGVIGPGDYISGSGDAYGRGRTMYGEDTFARSRAAAESLGATAPPGATTDSGGPLTGPNKDEVVGRSVMGADGSAVENPWDPRLVRRDTYDVGR
jgi:hypothetical protein